MFPNDWYVSLYLIACWVKLLLHYELNFISQLVLTARISHCWLKINTLKLTDCLALFTFPLSRDNWDSIRLNVFPDGDSLSQGTHLCWIMKFIIRRFRWHINQHLWQKLAIRTYWTNNMFNEVVYLTDFHAKKARSLWNMLGRDYCEFLHIQACFF